MSVFSPNHKPVADTPDTQRTAASSRTSDNGNQRTCSRGSRASGRGGTWTDREPERRRLYSGGPERGSRYLELSHVWRGSELVSSRWEAWIVGNVWGYFDDWLIGGLHEESLCIVAAHLAIVSGETTGMREIE